MTAETLNPDQIERTVASDRPPLNKDLFVRASHCDRYLWLRRNRPSEETPPGEGDKLRMRQGSEIGMMARGLYPGGVLVLRREGETAEDATARYLAEGHETLFEATFAFEKCLARVDILKRVPGGYEIHEVKSSKAKPDDDVESKHISDIAFQVWVARNTGLNVVGAHLVLLSRDFVREHSEPSAQELLVRIDLTAKVEKRLNTVPKDVEKMLAVLDGPEPPPELLKHCKDCGYFKACFPSPDVLDVAFVPKLTSATVRKLRAEGYQRIGDLPEELLEEGAQIRARQSAVMGRSVVLRSLTDELQRVRFPAVCVDFEAVGSAIPLYRGTGPYDAVPFQWSIHRMESFVGEPVHAEFLHLEASDPRPSFVQSLSRALDGAQTVLVYSSYEQTRIRQLLQETVEGAEELHVLFEDRDRTIDLLQLVRDNVYAPGFAGSFSIKTVLPALVPHLGYDDLVIRDGSTAAAAYIDLLGWLGTPNAELIARDLLAYCKRDTLAMVEVLRALSLLSENPTH